jgi:hypothetical protein
MARAAILIATALSAAICGLAKLLARKIRDPGARVTKFVLWNLPGVTIFLANLRCGDLAPIACRGVEIRKDGLLLNLTLAQCGQIVRDRLFFVQPDLAGVGPHETFVEHSAGKLVKVFVFQGAQHAVADFRDAGDGIERDAALLALLAKFLSERSHGWLRRTDSISARIEME